MKIERVTPMLATGDMDATIAFYRDVLGFEMGDKFESGGTVWWCEMRREGGAIMFTQHEVNVDAPGAKDGFGQTSVNFYLDEGVEALHAELGAKGVETSDVRVTFYGMKEFDFRDPSGYTIVIGERTDEAPTVEAGGDAPF